MGQEKKDSKEARGMKGQDQSSMPRGQRGKGGREVLPRGMRQAQNLSSRRRESADTGIIIYLTYMANLIRISIQIQHPNTKYKYGAGKEAGAAQLETISYLYLLAAGVKTQK